MGNEIKVIEAPILLDEIKNIAAEQFGEMVKAVVDLEKNVIAIGGELHADEEALLLERGSETKNLWGINLYPTEFPQEHWIEFNSMINIRPAQGNRSRGVENADIQSQIREIVSRLINPL